MAEKEDVTMYTMVRENQSVNDVNAIPFYVVQSFGYSFENSILTYESVGADGGFSINAGSLTQDIPVTIQTVSDLKESFEFMRKLKNEKEPVTIFSQVNNANLFGLYLITKADLNVTDGSDTMLINVTFREYRNATVQTVNQLIPADKSAAAVIQFMEDRNKVDKS